MTIEEEIARALNDAGWTCECGSDEPGSYDECEDCRKVCDKQAATLSPILNRVRAEAAAEALREAAASSQAKMFSPAVYVGPRRLKLGIGAKEWLNDCADRIEQGER